MRTSHPCETADLTLFAMQLLNDEEHSFVAEHASGCSFCLNELAYLQGNLASFAYTVEMLSPSPALRERVLHQVAREKKTLCVEPQAPPRMKEILPLVPEPEEPVLSMRRPVRSASSARSGPPKNPSQPAASSAPGRLVLWLGWAAAAGLALAGFQLYREQDAGNTKIATQAAEIHRLHQQTRDSARLLRTLSSASSQQVLLAGEPASPSAAAPQGRAVYVMADGALVFLANSLEPLPYGKTYELWLIPADGHDPIPAGTFHPNARGEASVILPSLPRAIEAKAFGVTMEAEGGSQTPTLPIVMAGN